MGKLTAVSCAKLGDGRYGDGDGLSLLVRGTTRAWTYSYTLHGQRREMGLGKLSVVGLAEARKLAADARALVRQGTDPIQQRKEAAKEKQPTTALTLLKIARTYHETFVEPVLTTKHARQWINSIEQHIPETLLSIPPSDIEPGKLLTVMQPLYNTIPETARRVRQRLEVIYDYAVLQGLTKTNPAQMIARSLRQKRERGQFKSMPYTELPAFMAEASTIN